MTLYEFRQSLTATEPLAGLTHALAVFSWDGKGDWAQAHESAQQEEASRVVLLKIPVLIGLRGLDFRLTILIFL